MGYESRFYAVKRYDFGYGEDEYHSCEVIAMLNMCKMGYSETTSKFLKLFDTEAMINLWLPGVDDDGNEIMMEQHEDKYGEPLNYITNIDEGIRLIHKMIGEDDYWRLPLLLKFLETYNDPTGNIKIIHYGY